MKLKVFDIKGKEKKEIEVSDEIFGIQPNRFCIYEAIKNELANKRQGTSSTKTKAEVSGSGAKPWRQKGTGRASFGTKRNPVWVHGGIAFGPKPRDYSYTLPKKVKTLAYKSVFSGKTSTNNLVVVENIDLSTGKTKDLVSIVSLFLKDKENKKSSFIVTDKDFMLKRAGRNLSWLKCMSYMRLNVHDLYYSPTVLITEDAITELNKLLLK
ncbi:MAG TPA: 50S ribosomal protein L4 [Spirochaetota bacterium]|nr:50S ribosomal protein L4 [Spirochaetota bacterium]